MIVERLSVYPVTGTRALDEKIVTLGPSGFLGDRAYVVYDPETHQRLSNKPGECPELMRIQTYRGSLRPVLFFHNEQGERTDSYDLSDLHVYPSEGEPVTVDEFGDQTPCRDMGEVPAKILSNFLGRTVRLALKSGDWLQGKDGLIAPAARKNRPVHLITRASMDALAGQLRPNEDAARRFRPNVVIGGKVGEPDIEQTWRHIQVGSAVLRVIEPTVRCLVTGQDPLSGIRLNDVPRLFPEFPQMDVGGDRSKPTKGIYAVLDSPVQRVEINVNDPIKVLE